MTDAPGDYPAARKDASEALGIPEPTDRLAKLWRGASQYRPSPTQFTPDKTITMPSGRQTTLPRGSDWQYRINTSLEQQQLTNAELDYMGLGDWDYRNANATHMLGPNGRSLPDGAVGWDAQGKPWFGSSGIAEIGKRWFHNATARPSWVKEDEKITVVDRVRRGLGVGLQTVFDIAMLPAQAVEHYFGLAQTIAEAGEEFAASSIGTWFWWGYSTGTTSRTSG